MNYFILAGGALGLVLFYPLCMKILRKESVQNPFTYFLWSSLDAVSAGSTYLEGGKYLQATLYAAGGMITFFCILRAKGPIKWTKFETLIALLAIFCIEVWILNDNMVAAIASLCALTIASIPQIVDTWKQPKDTPTLIYFGYTLSGLLATLGGKEVSVVEIGYPFLGFLVCSTITVFSLREFPIRKTWQKMRA